MLSFVARRLAAEQIAMLFGVREPSAEQELDGLPVLALEGLGDGDARLLLDAAVPGGLDEEVRSESSPRRGATRSRCWSCREG